MKDFLLISAIYLQSFFILTDYYLVLLGRIFHDIAAIFKSASIVALENNLDLMMSYDVLCTFTVDGEIIDVFNYETDALHVSKPKEITVNDDVYTMKYSNFLVHFLGGNRYDMIIKTNANGETVIFDSQKALPNDVSSLLAFIIVFNIAAPGFFIYIFKYAPRQTTVWDKDYNPLLHKNKFR